MGVFHRPVVGVGGRWGRRWGILTALLLVGVEGGMEGGIAVLSLNPARHYHWYLVVSFYSLQIALFHETIGHCLLVTRQKLF